MPIIKNYLSHIPMAEIADQHTAFQLTAITWLIKIVAYKACPQEFLDFGEFLSELISRAPMHSPHPPPLESSPLLASFEGSILLCNDYRHASASTRAPRAGEWSMCKVISLG